MNDAEMARVREAYRLLRRLTAASNGTGRNSNWIPAWSSAVLERTVEQVLSQPDGRLSELFHALWGLIANVPLDRTLANFLKDIVVLCFTRYRALYDATDFQWMTTQLRGNGTQAQAYLASLALPENLVGESRSSILAKLEGTEFKKEVQKML